MSFQIEVSIVSFRSIQRLHCTVVLWVMG